jgi:serine/tyrosine/threonine adenylyltransferase
MAAAAAALSASSSLCYVGKIHALIGLGGFPMNHCSTGWRFDNSYSRLPDFFFTRQKPVSVKQPRMLVFNAALAESLGLLSNDWLGEEGARALAGNDLPEGADPIAQAYAGHQFGYFTKLGDGRAILLGEQLTPAGQRVDIQLKGSGQTAFSRRGDGRAALGPMLREYLISEAMAALGIPTTRSLAVISTGETVHRDRPLPGAILTRVAASHIRVGTFEYAAAEGGEDKIRALADYTLQRHYPDLADADNPYLSLLLAVMDRQAALVAQWQAVGFIHGVMNTDNMTLNGETIDYGPCAFMDTYHPTTVFSSIDHQGRYAYANQPPIAQWNLARLAETFIPLLHPDREKALALAIEAVKNFPDRFQEHWLFRMRGKFGLLTQEPEDEAMIESFFTWMEQNRKDFTHSFQTLKNLALPEAAPPMQDDFWPGFEAWQARLARQPQSREAVFATLQAHNPVVIPRNRYVEEALEAAEQGNMVPFEKLLSRLQTPYASSDEDTEDFLLPAPSAETYRTFCGT